MSARTTRHTVSMKYVAFLRGINMIGHRPVKMSVVQKIFEDLGFQNIKTIGASGNVLFETSKEHHIARSKEIQETLENATGHSMKVVLRTVPEVESLVKLNPFKGITISPHTKFLITFLSETPKHKITIPYTSPENDFKVLQLLPNEVCSVAFLSPSRQRTGVLSFLEKEFGKGVTTRNWSTITKLLRG